MQLFPPLFGSTRSAGNPRATFCESRRWVRVTTAGDPVPLEKGRRAPRWRPTLRLHGSEVGGGREPFPTPIKADNVTATLLAVARTLDTTDIGLDLDFNEGGGFGARKGLEGCPTAWAALLRRAQVADFVDDGECGTA